MSGGDRVLAVIGAGPRTTGLLERIAANADVLPDGRWTIHVVDPHPPGAGQVWRHDQSPLLLMNSRAGEVTMFTDRSVRCVGPVRPGPTLHEWGTTAGTTLADPILAAEAGGLTEESFASRRLGGQYLAWCFDQAVASLPDRVGVCVHRARAVALRDGPRQRVSLSDGTRLDADLVVLAQGNIGGHADEQQRAHAEFARHVGGTYLPPACAADIDLDRLPSGEPVIVVGLGLAFIDLMAMVTEGRGGRFSRRRDGRLCYLPGGHEPVLHVGSRRGVPYLPKSGQRLLGERSAEPAFFTREHVLHTLATSKRPQSNLLVRACRELVWAYYRELFTGHPDRTTCSWPEFADRYTELEMTDPELAALVARVVPDPADHVDLSFLRSPLTGLTFPSRAALDEWMCERITTTVRRATEPRHSAHAAALQGLVTVAEQVERLFNTGDVARRVGLERFAGRLAGLTGFLGSGPPPHRLEQLVALAEAGVVRFLGANLTVHRDDSRGAFTARTDTLAEPVHARHLVEARLPDPDVRSGADPLLATLAGETTRLAVDPTTFQQVNDRGTHPRRIAMGAFATGGALGSFSRPNRDAAFFRQNDATARWLLTT